MSLIIIKEEEEDHIYDDEEVLLVENDYGPRSPHLKPVSDTPVDANNGIPCLSKFPGDYRFGVSIPSSSGGKGSWMYSRVLNQVFIDINKIMMIEFHLNEYRRDLFIRAMPVYTSPDFISEPVVRCAVHTSEDDPRNVAHQEGRCFCSEFNDVGHVLRITTSTSNLDAMYSYNEMTGRHSVVVNVTRPAPGSTGMVVPYFFACKTSCPRGMQRRPICVLFTLEDNCGNVLGRDNLLVKICTCPKRDMVRLERDVLVTHEKSLSPEPQVPRSSSSSSGEWVVDVLPAKRRKSEQPLDEHESLEKWKENVLQVLDSIQDRVTQLKEIVKQGPRR